MRVLVEEGVEVHEEILAMGCELLDDSSNLCALVSLCHKRTVKKRTGIECV